MTATVFERPPMVALKCQSCGQIDNTMSIAEARGLGWRIWDGQTMGGKDSSVRICPRCMGGTRPDDTDGGWDATCDTCDACMSTDEALSPAEITEDDAEAWCSTHVCDADTRTIAPRRKDA